MAIVVADASAIVELLLSTPAGAQVSELLEGNTPVAPAHIDAEALSALARMVRASALEARFVPDALGRLARSPIRRLPLPPLLGEAWELRANVTPADALYVVCARRLRAQLVTADARLSRAPRLGIPILLAGG